MGGSTRHRFTIARRRRRQRQRSMAAQGHMLCAVLSGHHVNMIIRRTRMMGMAVMTTATLDTMMMGMAVMTTAILDTMMMGMAVMITATDTNYRYLRLQCFQWHWLQWQWHSPVQSWRVDN